MVWVKVAEEAKGKVEVRVKVKVKVRVEVEWVAMLQAQAVNVDAPIADIRYHIKWECPAISRHARNVGLTW